MAIKPKITFKYYWAYGSGKCYGQHLGGRKECRLPTIEELASLVDPTQGPPTLPNGHPFINVQSSYYWSSTTTAGNTNLAWRVGMHGGDVLHQHKDPSYYVWPVRGGE